MEKIFLLACACQNYVQRYDIFAMFLASIELGQNGNQSKKLTLSKAEQENSSEKMW